MERGYANRSFIQHLHSPFTLISATSIVIIASARLAYSLVTLLAIIWVYVLSALVSNSAKRIMPRFYNNILSIALIAVLGSVFYLVLYFLNPLLALEMMLILMLMPVLCYTSGICSRTQNETLKNAGVKAFYEAILIGFFIVVFSLVREPLGFASLSLPGGHRAIYELFNFDSVYPLPIQIIAGSAGALLLLGYIFIIYRLITIHPQSRRDNQTEEGSK